MTFYQAFAVVKETTKRFKDNPEMSLLLLILIEN
jgi:hypothetical protein